MGKDKGFWADNDIIAADVVRPSIHPININTTFLANASI